MATPYGGQQAFETQGVGLRFVALLIDGVILFVVNGIVLTQIMLHTFDARTVTRVGDYEVSSLGGTGLVLMHLLGLLIAFLYWTVTEATMGATIGKRALKLQVVAEDGSRLTWRASAVRNIFKTLDSLTYMGIGFVGLIVGAIMIAATGRHQRLGDMLGHTVVIKGLPQAAAAAYGSAVAYGPPGGPSQGPPPGAPPGPAPAMGMAIPPWAQGQRPPWAPAAPPPPAETAPPAPPLIPAEPLPAPAAPAPAPPAPAAPAPAAPPAAPPTAPSPEAAAPPPAAPPPPAEPAAPTPPPPPAAGPPVPPPPPSPPRRPIPTAAASSCRP